MSLRAQYDDLCRYTAVLTTGCEKEFKLFVEAQKRFFLENKNIKSEIAELRLKIHSLETDKIRFEAQLKHMRNVLISENEKCRKLELEKNSMERQIAVIKELLSDDSGLDNQTREKLVQLSTAYSQQNILSKLTTIEESGSLLSSSDCDETEDFFDKNITVRKSSLCKKRSSTDHNEKQNVLEGKNYLNGFAESEELVSRKSTVTFRSSSEPNTTLSEEPIHRQVHRSDSEQVKEHVSNIRRSSNENCRTSLPVGRYSTGGKLSRTHAFVTKTFIRSEKCNPCGKVIKFCKQALKCSDCRISCHLECKDHCPLPCIPIISAPLKSPVGTVADYTSSTSPMIPSLIVHCVNEIESRGFNDIGLYRVPGSEREVKELIDKFLKGKNVPILNDVDIHVICGTVKGFLKSLKDSLITKAAWQSFADASNQQDENAKLNMLCNVICNLPQPNKETLAYLILHLQRIAESPVCKMPIENLSKIFGPTIVGYPVTEPDNVNMFVEIKQQTKIMKELLSISSDFWQNVLSIDSSAFESKIEVHDASLRAPVTSRLGPIYSCPKSRNSIQVSKTSLDPRNPRTSHKTEKRKYFASPILK